MPTDDRDAERRRRRPRWPGASLHVHLSGQQIGQLAYLARDVEYVAMEPGSPEWHAQVNEPIVDPERRIIDPHHHLWPAGGALPYGLDELHSDTGDGHNIVGTVFVECSAGYLTEGPTELRSLGETAFVAGEAAKSAALAGPEILGIVATADLRLDNLDDQLAQHEQAGDGRLRGIRHALARDDDPALVIRGNGPEGLAEHEGFLRGVQRLAAHNLTYESWHYHHQNAAFCAVAAQAPETTVVLDHFGTPLGVGRYEGTLDTIFEQWKLDIAAIAALPNTIAKLGGLAMPDNGYGWHARELPANSDEIVDAHERWYHHAIECFGPNRCMFESNFPVDRLSLSYRTLWNALKKIASRYDETEQAAMFEDTARRVYRL